MADVLGQVTHETGSEAEIHIQEFIREALGTKPKEGKQNEGGDELSWAQWPSRPQPPRGASGKRTVLHSCPEQGDSDGCVCSL